MYKACWIESDDDAELDTFKKRKAQYMAFDKEGRVAAHGEYAGNWERMVGPSPTTETGWKTFRDYYYNTIQDCDNHMLQLLNYLDEAGLLKNTIIIYTSDHGEMQGEHGLKGKGGYI